MPRARAPRPRTRLGATDDEQAGDRRRRARRGLPGADELVHHAESAVDLHAALVGAEVAADDAQQRRLARAVRADERGRAPLGHAEGEVGEQRPAVGQREGDAVDVDEAHGCVPFGSRPRPRRPMGSRSGLPPRGIRRHPPAVRQAGGMQRIAAEPLDVLRTRTSAKWRIVPRRRAAAARRRDGLPARGADRPRPARRRRPLGHRLLVGQPPGGRGVPGLRGRPGWAGTSTPPA